MKKVIFYSNQLGVRGTEVAMYDHAVANEEVLGNKSYIASRKNSDLFTLKKFLDRFEVFLFDDVHELDDFALSVGAEYIYLCRSGEKEFLLNNAKNLVYAVFNVNEPHGDKYMYISKWLAEVNNNPDDYIPYIVTLPDVGGDLREELGIPINAFVWGRHGGENQFNLPMTISTVYHAAVENPDTYFLFMNTDKFCQSLPNIIHLPPNYDLEYKVKFINTCNAMIHGRAMGESFGLAISEFLFMDKPVVAWTGGHDQNHRVMLEHTGLMYSNEDDLKQILSKKDFDYEPGYFKKIVEEFSPANVMRRFEEKFLN
jgi:hypothetical protein